MRNFLSRAEADEICDGLMERYHAEKGVSCVDIDGFVKLYYKADDIIKGNINQYKDAYGMYKIGDKTYKNLETCDATGYHYTTAANEIVEIGSCEDSFEAVNNLIDQYAVKNGTKDLYYSYNGHFYNNLSYSSRYDSTAKQYRYIVYASVLSEISFDKSYVKISWNRITNDTETLTNKAGDLMKVGYEVICNDNDNVYDMSGLYLDASDGTLHRMTTSNQERLPYVVLNAGEQVNVKVRAVYYHEVTDIRQDEYQNWSDKSKYVIESKQTKYVADMYGEWSDV